MKVLSILVFAIELFLSHQTGDRSGEESKALARVMRIDEGWLRQAAHVILFFLLSLFAGLGFGPWALLGCVIWSVVDEISKRSVPGRHSSLRDMFLNLAGVAAGGLIVFLL